MMSVDRSNEFLSACVTALKIAQRQLREREQPGDPGGSGRASNDAPPEWLATLSPSDLVLYREPRTALGDEGPCSDARALLRDSQTLLHLLDAHLADLHALVRRRGHTNDPTLEIQAALEKFQEGAQEVQEVCAALRLAGTRPCEDRRSSAQRRKHYELLSAQLERRAKERTDRLKRALETRSQVLREQSHRRKLLASGGGDGSVGLGGAKPAGVVGMRTTQPHKTALDASAQFQSPLFTATSGRGTVKKNGAAAYSGYAGYGGSASNGTKGGHAGYGAATSEPPSFATGMRQRKQPPPQPKSHIQIDSGNEDNDYENKYSKSQDSTATTSVQQQIALRRENRATHSRAQQARLAEKSIAELGVMFTKMSSLISQQGEVLERIEDDVEAAAGDIDAGHAELVKVYGMTKGNRGLILKVFGILIFLLLFMKLY